MHTSILELVPVKATILATCADCVLQAYRERLCKIPDSNSYQYYHCGNTTILQMQHKLTNLPISSKELIDAYNTHKRECGITV